MPTSASTTAIRSDDSCDDVYEPKLFQGSGRLGRIRFLLYMEILALAPALLIVFAVFSGVTWGNADTALAMTLIAIFSGVPSAIFMFILCVRRFNDFDARGWWVLASFIPLIGILVSLALLFVPGTPGKNRYGVPPAPESSTMKLLCVLVLVVNIVLVMIGNSMIISGGQGY